MASLSTGRSTALASRRTRVHPWHSCLRSTLATRLRCCSQPTSAICGVHAHGRPPIPLELGSLQLQALGPALTQVCARLTTGLVPSSLRLPPSRFHHCHAELLLHGVRVTPPPNRRPRWREDSHAGGTLVPPTGTRSSLPWPVADPCSPLQLLWAWLVRCVNVALGSMISVCLIRARRPRNRPLPGAPSSGSSDSSPCSPSFNAAGFVRSAAVEWGPVGHDEGCR
jgi:hypothetical protein